jgi:Na+/H+ antiporter NhaD/arsenite permease-like protein
MTIALIAMVYDALRQRTLAHMKEVIGQIDYVTLLLLIGLFMIIATLSAVGIIDDIASIFVTFGGDNPFILFTLVVWLSVLLSAFIDNIPYVVTMLPVMAALAGQLDVNPTLLYFGLLAGATLGGNLTPIGASANIAGIGLLRKAGYQVKFIDFAKIAFPMTLVAVTTAYILIWFLWA